MGSSTNFRLMSTVMAVVGILILISAIVLKTLAILFILSACLFVVAMLMAFVELPRRPSGV